MLLFVLCSPSVETFIHQTNYISSFYHLDKFTAVCHTDTVL